MMCHTHLAGPLDQLYSLSHSCLEKNVNLLINQSVSLIINMYTTLVSLSWALFSACSLSRSCLCHVILTSCPLGMCIALALQCNTLVIYGPDDEGRNTPGCVIFSLSLPSHQCTTTFARRYYCDANCDSDKWTQPQTERWHWAHRPKLSQSCDNLNFKFVCGLCECAPRFDLWTWSVCARVIINSLWWEWDCRWKYIRPEHI